MKLTSTTIGVISLSLIGGCTSNSHMQNTNTSPSCTPTSTMVINAPKCSKNTFKQSHTLPKISANKQIFLAPEIVPLAPLPEHQRINIFNETPILP